jgi:hypothetical protein
MPAPMAVTLTVRRTTRPWPFAGGGVGDGHLGPGQSFQLGQERRQVAFDRQQVVRATAGEVADMAPLGVRATAGEVADMAPLGVQRVGGDDRPGDVHAVQQRAERVDLIGLPVHHGLPEHDTGGGVERGQQMCRPVVAPAGPRAVLPSTAITRRRSRPARTSSHVPITVSNISASMISP